MQQPQRIQARFRALVSLLILTALACNASDLPVITPTASATPTTLPATPTVRPTDVPATPVIEVPTDFSDEGRTLYLSNEQIRVGIDSRWGGAIREIWFEGQNLINNYDGGRLIGVSFYDGDRLPASSHPNDTGWNPTPSDMYNHSNEPLEVTFEQNILYIRTRYLQWFPNDKGGGPDRPVPTNIIVESWLRFFTDPQVLQLRYRLTNEGDQDHAVHAQEFPFIYPRTPYHRYVTYGGDQPWTQDEVLIRDIPLDQPASGLTVASEGWAAMLNDSGTGLTLWAPQAYPNFSYKHFNNSSPAENDSLYLQPRTFLAIPAQGTIETEAYLFFGSWQQARAKISRLRQYFDFADVMNPFGFLDSPADGAEVSGIIPVDGWAIDDRGLDRIEIRLDGQIVGQADYGQARPDVEQNYPGLPAAPNYGYSYHLNSGSLSAGVHTLEVIAIDQAGHHSVLRPGAIEISVRD